MNEIELTLMLVTGKELDLAPIKSRLEDATDGPWEWIDPTTLVGWEGPDDYRHNVYVLEVEHDNGCECRKGCTLYEMSEADRTFVANAPIDIAALIGEVERLRELLVEGEMEGWE